MRDNENRNTVKCKTDKIHVTDKIRKMTESKENKNKREKLKR